MSMSGNGEPPAAVLKLRPWFIGVLTAQFCLMVLRFSMVDIWGGFYLLILIGLGSYAVKDGVNVMFTSYYGFMALITGVFDLVAFIDMMAKGMPYFVPGMVWRNIQVMGLSLSCPICICAAYLAWKAYSLNDAGSLPYSGGNQNQGQESSGFFGGGGDYGTSAGNTSPQAQTFTAFSGGGNKLGAN